jgi:predicted RNA-binding protein associated with RNAse of E/G family
VSIDVCTPAELSGDAWTYVDLELDVYRAGDGGIGVFDEDELEEAVAHGLISEEEHGTCLEVAAELAARLRVGDDPVFDGLAWSRLEAAMALDLRPLATA